MGLMWLENLGVVVPILIIKNEWAPFSPSFIISKNKSNENFEKNILFNIVKSSRNYVFLDAKFPSAILSKKTQAIEMSLSKNSGVLKQINTRYSREGLSKGCNSGTTKCINFEPYENEKRNHQFTKNEMFTHYYYYSYIKWIRFLCWF